MKIFKWGIIGPGKIAEKFAEALLNCPNAELWAVASRDKERAESFGKKYRAAKYYDQYEALINDEEIDVVYVATPHTFHYRHVLLCVKNKKPVLCEKPLSVNYQSALEMITLAKENKVFLMEAMWTRFLPVIKEVFRLVEEGEIGKIIFVRADFGFSFPYDTENRIFNMKLGGGSLLDIGVYPLFLALSLLGEPDSIKTSAHFSTTGADESMNIMLSYKNGEMASLYSTILATTPTTAEITGTKGSITIQQPWYKASAIVLRKPDGTEKNISMPYGDNGFEFEINEVMNCLEQGTTESTLMSLDFSLMMARVVNEICNQCAIRYEVQ
ncbi:Gfo/Idh/MocA family protein [Terrimonas pollutisoli]|uniref:Gfo/Idh/MocA family protein n=1 Tax=Terrimonas pollutisoli TaxID=3034147 RepID=UPI0023ECFB30|nr:Gfo/Idh/MocA family oxidoreductase [Terrimonas sp. H1YJ31]